MGTASSKSAGRDRIAEALFGHTRRQVLALFFGRPHEAFYLRQMVRETGAGLGAVQREVKRLLNAGLITRVHAGSQIHYSANRDSPVYGELHSLLTKTAGIADILRKALMTSPGRKWIRSAFIYGSVAAGRQSSRSDIDLMVVGDTATVDLLPKLRKAQDRLGREINPTVYDEIEFREKARAGTGLIARILAQPRIMLIGTADDLEKLVGKPLDRPS
jgi:predicted nucleotidyltransferase